MLRALEIRDSRNGDERSGKEGIPNPSRNQEDCLLAAANCALVNSHISSLGEWWIDSNSLAHGAHDSDRGPMHILGLVHPSSTFLWESVHTTWYGSSTNPVLT